MSNHLYVIIHQNGGENGVQMNGGEMSNEQLNINQSSGCQMQQVQIKTGQRNGGQPNEEQWTPEEQNGDLQTNAGEMIFARDLEIEHSDKYENWDWVSDPRFITEVAVLSKVWFFHIKTSVNFLRLSANTQYGAYLIFKRAEDSKGLHAIMNTSVSAGREHDKRSVCLKPTRNTPSNIGRPREFSDRWLELELGRFYCDNVTADKEVVIIIQETKRLDIKKAGLTVAGLTWHPIICKC
ncbi:F-box protein PP2-B10-like [Carex rostrata]